MMEHLCFEGGTIAGGYYRPTLHLEGLHVGLSTEPDIEKERDDKDEDET